MSININLAENLRSPIAEAFRSIRTNIQFSNVDQPLKSFVVTSAMPGEGKSTVAFNLAVSIAQNGKKVVLVDADLRKPSIYTYIESDSYIGLTNIIAQDISYRSALQSLESLELLDIVLAGPIPPNPSEILGSMKMKKLLEELKQDYEMVILDSPPVGMFTDAAVISTMVDGAVVVCAAKKTRRDDLAKAVSTLNKVGAKLTGIVINKVRYRKNHSYNSYYYKKQRLSAHREGK